MFPLGHIRTPRYIMGHRGRICHVVGEFPNPEELAYGRNGFPKKMLYRVRFRQNEIWPDYGGAPGDTLEIELYEHWLKPAPESESQEGRP
jgi:nitrile hydratase